MTRKTLTDGSNKWFNIESSEKFDEGTFHNGQNWISKATNSQWNHETLYRTKGKQWVLVKNSNIQGTQEEVVLISNDEAAEWFSKNELEPHEDCEKEFLDLEIE